MEHRWDPSKDHPMPTLSKELESQMLYGYTANGTPMDFGTTLSTYFGSIYFQIEGTTAVLVMPCHDMANALPKIKGAPDAARQPTAGQSLTINNMVDFAKSIVEAEDPRRYSSRSRPYC